MVHPCVGDLAVHRCAGPVYMSMTCTKTFSLQGNIVVILEIKARHTPADPGAGA